jgi:hypothetical protein
MSVTAPSAAEEKLLKIFQGLPAPLVLAVARSGADPQNQVATLIAIVKLGPDVLGQVSAKTGGQWDDALPILQVLLQTRASPAASNGSGRGQAAAAVSRSRVSLHSIDDTGNSCGYCGPQGKGKKKEARGSISYGCQFPIMTARDYQDMIDRGWRRSGSYLYRMTNEQTCCPAYTIRLDVHKFQPTKVCVCVRQRE